MRLSVFGGTRGTGLQLVEQALAEGHEVTALARHRSALAKFPDVRVVKGDVFDSNSVNAALRGSKAAVSTLGFVGRSKETTIYSEGVLNVARAMQEQGTRRLVVLAASQGIDPHPDFSFGVSLMMKLMIKPMFGFAYRDMAKMAELIAKLDVDWTLVGVPWLTNGARKGKIRNSIEKPIYHAFRVSRADVAKYMLSILDDPATFKRRVEIA